MRKGSAMSESRIKRPQEAVAQVIEWLELDTPPAAEVMESLSQRFLVAACNPASTYILIASKKNVVQVYGGKAVCNPVPEGTDFNDELRAKFGARFLDYSNIFATCMLGLEGPKRQKVQAMAEASYEEADPAHRLVFGA